MVKYKYSKENSKLSESLGHKTMGLMDKSYGSRLPLVIKVSNMLSFFVFKKYNKWVYI